MSLVKKHMQKEPNAHYPQHYLVPGDIGRMEEIKRVIKMIFPVNYSESFHANLFAENVMTYMMYDEKEKEYVGILSIRLFPLNSDYKPSPYDGMCEEVCANCISSNPDIEMIKKNYGYISFVGLLEKCRGKGLGKIMIEKAENICRLYGLSYISLHVQISNLNAINFYSRLNFKMIKYIKNYYYNIYPKDAFLLRKCLCSRPA